MNNWYHTNHSYFKSNKIFINYQGSIKLNVDLPVSGTYYDKVEEIIKKTIHICIYASKENNNKVVYFSSLFCL